MFSHLFYPLIRDFKHYIGFLVFSKSEIESNTVYCEKYQHALKEYFNIYNY